MTKKMPKKNCSKEGKEKVPTERDCGKEIERKGKYIKMPSDKKKRKTFHLQWKSSPRRRKFLSSSRGRDVYSVCTSRRGVSSIERVHSE
jgi:hypothetical protein